MSTVLIVEYIAEVRKWLSSVAREAFSGITDVVDVGSKRDAIDQLHHRDFAFAMIDLGLPNGSGMDVLRELRARSPETLCVITTVMGDDANIVSALSAGANGYLLKGQRRELVVRQLSQLADGIPALSPSIALRIMEHFRLTGPVDGENPSLTNREKDVLSLIARGMRNVDVAQQLKISGGTVAHHIKAIYRKLGISSRAEASWHAARLGLTSSSPN